MELDPHRTSQAEIALYDLLGPELTEITKVVSSSSDYLIKLPEAYDIDLTLEDLASLVARTSNAFGRLARFAGMARAEAKLARGRYERKFKRARSGKNEAERTANAMGDAVLEHTAMVTAEAIAEMADAMEGAARISSESARKIFDKATNMGIASRREQHGSYQEKDYSSNW